MKKDCAKITIKFPDFKTKYILYAEKISIELGTD